MGVILSRFFWRYTIPEDTASIDSDDHTSTNGRDITNSSSDESCADSVVSGGADYTTANEEFADESLANNSSPGTNEGSVPLFAEPDSITMATSPCIVTTNPTPSDQLPSSQMQQTQPALHQLQAPSLSLSQVQPLDSIPASSAQEALPLSYPFQAPLLAQSYFQQSPSPTGTQLSSHKLIPLSQMQEVPSPIQQLQPSSLSLPQTQPLPSYQYPTSSHLTSQAIGLTSYQPPLILPSSQVSCQRLPSISSSTIQPPDSHPPHLSPQVEEVQPASDQPSLLGQALLSSSEQLFISAGSCPESRALCQHSDELFKAISASDLLGLAWQLHAKYLIGLDTTKYCQLPAVISTEKSSKIVCAVIETVSASPQLFEPLLSVLNESGSVALMSAGEKLKKTYESLKDLLAKTPCHSHSFHTHPNHPPIMSQQSQNQSAVLRYANYLRAVYKQSELSNPACYKWMCSPSEKFKFINLAVISKTNINKEEAERIKKETIYGHIDLILKEKAPITIGNILQVEEGQSLTCVLIEGAPGVGKSTLAWEICRRWEIGELFQRYSIVLLVTLRDERVHRATCVVDLFRHSDKKLQEEVVQEIAKTDGKETLILLEGLDELPTHFLTDCSIFTDLLSGAVFSEATLLVTSRPSATDKLWQRWWQRISRHIEILGFTEDNIDEYSKSVLSDQLSGFIDYLSIHPHIKSMMYVPLHCAIATTVYLQCQQSYRPPPRTLTGLYTCLAQIILMQYLQDHPDYKEKNYRLNSFSDLPSPIYNSFKSLCSLAFEGINKQQLIFRNLPQLMNTHQQLEHFGFMDAVPERLFLSQQPVDYSYNFLHLSIQEYLAAYHASLMSPCDQEQLLQTVRYGDHRFNMIQFLAGITQLKCLDKGLVRKVIGITLYYDIRHLAEYTLRILYECQDVSILDGEWSYYISVQPTDSVHCLTALGYCIANSSSKWHVVFSGRDDNGIKVLCNSLKENPRPTYSIENIKFKYCTQSLSHQVLQCLPECVLKGLKNITIMYYKSDLQPLPPALPKLIPRMERLHTLEFGNVADSSVTELIPVLSKVPTLRNLKFHRLKSNGIALLCKWLPMCQLQELILTDINYNSVTVVFCNYDINIVCENCTNEFLELFFSLLPLQLITRISIFTIQKCSSYEELFDDKEPFDNEIPPLELLPCLPELIPRMERLETLTLEHVSHVSLNELIPILPSISTMRNLTLHELNTEGITLLCQWLPTCQLQTLTLYEVIFDYDRSTILFSNSIKDIECKCCTNEFLEQLFSQLPQQSLAHIRTFKMCYSNMEFRSVLPEELPPCLPELVPRMESLETLAMENVSHAQPLKKLIPILSSIHTLKNLTLHKLNSEGIALLCRWLPSYQLEKLTLYEDIIIRGVTLSFRGSVEDIKCECCTANFLNQIFSQFPQQLLIYARTFSICSNSSGDMYPGRYLVTKNLIEQPHCLLELPRCLLELIPRMEKLDTLTLENVLDSSLTELVPALSSVSTLRNLTLHKLNPEGIALLCQWLPTCQLETLTLHEIVNIRILQIFFPSKAIWCRYCTVEFVDQILIQQPLAQVKTLTIDFDSHQPLPHCLPVLISRMERLNTLTLRNVLHSSLIKLIPMLSRVPTLRNLSLHELNPEGIALLCQWLPTCQLETLIVCDEVKLYTDGILYITKGVTVFFLTETIFCYNSIIVLEFILPQLLQQSLVQFKTVQIHFTNHTLLPSCVLELIPRMKRLNILTLVNTSLTEIIPALSRVSTLRNLTLDKLNSESISLLCQWLPTCHLQSLTLLEEGEVKVDGVLWRRVMNIFFSSETIFFWYCTLKFIDQILSEIPQQKLEQIKMLAIPFNNHQPLPPCVHELIPRMKRLSTLDLKSVLDTSMTELIPVLSRVPSLRNLTLSKLNSESIALLCRWLPTCQLETLTLVEEIEARANTVTVLYRKVMNIFFSSEAILCWYCTLKFIDQILPQIPQKTLAQIKTLTIYFASQQTLPSYLPELIPRMERLDTLDLNNVHGTSLTELIPVLFRVSTLRNLTLHKLNSENITLFCQWLPRCQLKTLVFLEEVMTRVCVAGIFYRKEVVILFPSETILWHYCTISQILPQIPDQFLAQVKALIIKYDNHQPLLPSLRELIPKMERLNTLTLINVHVPDSSLTELIPVLSRAPTLRSLTLTILSSESTVLLCQWLSTCQLETLNLPNSLSPDHIEMVAKSLTTVSSLKTLDVQGSNFTFQSMQAFVSIFQQNQSLTEMNLSHCNIDSDSACSLAKVLYCNTTLRKLDMSWNPIGEKGALAMAEMLKHNTTIEELDLRHADIHSNGAVAMAEALHHNTTLRKRNVRWIL